jgi:hypothetical protein
MPTLDRLLGLGGKRRCKAECQPRRGGKQAAGERSLGDRTDGCVHRDVLLLTRGKQGKAVYNYGIASDVPS